VWPRVTDWMWIVGAWMVGAFGIWILLQVVMVWTEPAAVIEEPVETPEFQRRRLNLIVSRGQSEQ
jgi:hypothetical protein